MKKYFIYITIIITFFLLIIESSLRHFGYTPGLLISKNNLGEVFFSIPATENDVIETKEFYTDSIGIFRYNKIWFDTVSSTKLKNKVHHYFKNISLNEFGFRKAKKVNKNGKKIMMIGDSFTWGFTAKPIDSSFTDLLSVKYNIYNFGVPSVDIDQYLLILKHYLDSVKPESIVLNIYDGDDRIDYEKNSIPYYNQYFYTSNIGWLPKTNIDFKSKDSIMVFNSFEDSKKYILGLISFGKYHESSWVNKMLSKTVIGTFVGNIFFKKTIPYSYYYKDKKDFTCIRLNKIKDICKTNNVKLIAIIIPDKNNLKTKEEYCLENPYYYLADMSYYRNGYDSHFNNLGHKYYSEYIDSILNTKLHN